jgi:GTP-binding protein EngB required for normal cell division
MSSFRIFQETRDSLYTVLKQLADIAEKRQETTIVGINTDITSTKQELNRQSLSEILSERAESVRKKRAFRLAIVGEFNVGKSTFINALLRRQILSADVVPTTAAITTLRFGEAERFRVTYLPEYQAEYPTILQDSTNLFQDIAKYTSDPAQSDGLGIAILQGKEVSLAEKIKEVEVWCNADILRDREIDIEIIDTPGLGSVFGAHKTVTYSLIPEVDATLFLFTPDGIGEEDVALIKFLREYVNQMLFVMTKMDYTRDQTELDDSLRFNLETINTSNTSNTSVEKNNVQKIYPVSANYALSGRYEESGFPEFKQALESFLIKSSGITRLQIPLQVADLNWKILKSGVERDIELTNKSLKKVQDEREELEQRKQHINQRKQDLMRYIHDTIKDMFNDAMYGIDLLDTQIQIAVEIQVDAYSLKDLLKVDKQVSCIIKEKIDEWIAEKETRFQEKAKLLFRRIEEDLRVILETIQNTSSYTSENTRTDVITPQIKGVFTKSVLQFTQSAAINTGLALSTGLTLSSLIFSIGIAPVLNPVIPPTLVMIGSPAFPILILIPVLFAAGKVVQESLSLRNKLGVNIKREMAKSMPHNSINIYQAVVEGYIDDKGSRQPGMREILTNSFNNWSEKLKANVELIVTNNLDRHQQSLEKRIKEEQRGEWNYEATIKKYKGQMEDLLQAEKLLIEIKTTINNLSDSSEINNSEIK